MNYKEAMRYILSFTDYEKLPASSYSAADFDLRRVEELLHALGDPHLGPRTVHVAGTKGKGSTAAMIASALTAARQRTGLYTSPHLHTFRERIRIDGEMISEEEFAATVEKLEPHVDAVNRDGRFGKLTTFEVLTAAAFVHFRKQRVACQVLEVGLGGRLDATNVARPEVCVIAPISLDHTAILGNTVGEIAREKAGIIKSGATVVCAPQTDEAAAVIDEAAMRKMCKIIRVGHDVKWKKLSSTLDGQAIEITTPARSYSLTIPLLGAHQIENAAVAVTALEVLGVDSAAIAKGLASVSWPARLEILRRDPIVLVDGAHNADSARRLREAIKEYISYEDLILIIGMSSDKDIGGILRELAPLATKIIVTRARHPRALPVNTLLNELEKLDYKASYFVNVSDAVGQALLNAWPRDLICVTGSLFVAAEAIERIRGIPHDDL